jgi:hypothetical protein
MSPAPATAPNIIALAAAAAAVPSCTPSKTSAAAAKTAAEIDLLMSQVHVQHVCRQSDVLISPRSQYLQLQPGKR